MPLAGALVEPIPPMVSVWTPRWGFMSEGIGASAPGTGTWFGGNYAHYVPLWVPTFCPATQMWWVNGTAVSSAYFVRAGVYSDANHKPGTLLFATGAVAQGTASQVQFADFDVGVSVLISGYSDSDANSYATTSATLRAGLLYLVCFENSHASSAPAASTVQTTGGAVSFTSRESLQTTETGFRGSVWSAVPTSDVTATITIDFGSSSGVTGCIWSVLEIRGVDTTTDHGIVQSDTFADYTMSPSVTLSALGDSRNATLGVVATDSGATLTSGTGYLELSDVGSITPAARLGTEVKTAGSTTVDYSISETDCCLMAFELKSAKRTHRLSPALYWLALGVSSSSATIYRSTTVTTAYDELISFTQANAGPSALPSVATPGETSTNNIPLFGFST